MSMEDIMEALMQSAASQQQPQASGSSADAMAQMVGGMLGGGQQQGGGGGDMISQAIGALLGAQQSGAGAGALLDGLRKILGGTPGTGQPVPVGGSPTSAGSSDPIMTLLQPVVNKVAGKLGISPQLATIIVSIALRYLVQSSPNTPGPSPLNLGDVMQALASGRTPSPTALQQSGMVTEVMQSTGMDEQRALESLNATLGVLGGQLTPARTVRGAQGLKTARGVKSKASLRRSR
jgi:hypothetical protein